MDESVRIVKAQADAAAKALHVTFSDGACGSFAYVWLRDNAVHEGIVHDTGRTQYRPWPATAIDTEIEPVHCDVSDKRVIIKWPGVPDPVLYTVYFLHGHNMADGRVVALREQLHLGAGERVPWTADSLRAAFDSYDFERFVSDPAYALRACDFFVKYGLLHFTNYGTNERLGDYFGFLVPSHYGTKIFRVRNQASGDRSNAAYSTGGLNHHMDMAFIQYPPHIQVLHAVEQAGVGGDNVFSDALRIAEVMRREYPEHFAVLCSQPLEFYDRGVDPDGVGDFYTAGRRCVIQLGADGTVERVCYHNHGRSWYMPNTGGDPAKVRRVYEAFVRLNKLMADPEYEFRIKLKTGEAMMFANDRVSHSRLAFELAAGESRCFDGSYLHWDMVRSKIRLLKIANGVNVSPSV